MASMLFQIVLIYILLLCQKSLCQDCIPTIVNNELIDVDCGTNKTLVLDCENEIYVAVASNAFVNSPQLNEINMNNCSGVTTIKSGTFSILPDLRRLVLKSMSLTAFEDNLMGLTALTYLHLSKNPGLTELPDLPVTLKKLYVSELSELTVIPNLGVMTFLDTLYMPHTDVSRPDFPNPNSLTKLSITNIRDFELDTLLNLTQLTYLGLKDINLTEISEDYFDSHTSLKRLDLTNTGLSCCKAGFVRRALQTNALPINDEEDGTEGECINASGDEYYFKDIDNFDLFQNGGCTCDPDLGQEYVSTNDKCECDSNFYNTDDPLFPVQCSCKIDPNNCLNFNCTGNVCLTCEPSYYVEGSACSDCKTGTIATNGFCLDATNVIECFNENTGIECNACKVGHWLTIGNKCQDCKTSTIAINGFCLGATNVTECLNETSDIKCNACTDGYWLNNDNDCQECNTTAIADNGFCLQEANVISCFDELTDIKCDACKVGHWLNNDNYCLECNTTAIADNGFCFQEANVISCFDELTDIKCDACKVGHWLKNDNYCLDCKTGTIAANGFCLDAANVNRCFTETSDIKCNACQNGYWLNTDDSCQACKSSIGCAESLSECFPDNSLKCNICEPNFFLDYFVCKECNTTAIADNGFCLQETNVIGCFNEFTDIKCDACKAGYWLNNDNNCLDCKTGTIAANGFCFNAANVTKCSTETLEIECNACEEGFWLNIDNSCEGCKKAIGCAQPLNECLPDNSDELKCDICESNHYLDGFVCRECNTTTIADNGFCLQEANVIGCSNETSDIKCDACNVGHWLNNDKSCQGCKAAIGCAESLSECLPANSDEFQCNVCESNYFLEDFVCKDCKRAIGCADALAECLPENSDELKCSICEPNYFLEDFICKAHLTCKNECLNDGICDVRRGICDCPSYHFGSQCERCYNKDPFCKVSSLFGQCSDDFKFERCLECDLGYFINGSGKCQALSDGCSRGIENQCYTCFSPEETIIDGRCVCDSSTCHDIQECDEVSHCDIRLTEPRCIKNDLGEIYAPCLTCDNGFYVDNMDKCEACPTFNETSTQCLSGNEGHCNAQGYECELCGCIDGSFNDKNSSICTECYSRGHCKDELSVSSCSCDGETIECALYACEMGYFNSVDDLRCRPYVDFNDEAHCSNVIFIYLDHTDTLQLICQNACYHGFEHEGPFGVCKQKLPCEHSNPCTFGGDSNATCVPLDESSYDCACSSLFDFNNDTCTACDPIFQDKCSFCTDAKGCLNCNIGFSNTSTNCTDECLIDNCEKSICLGDQSLTPSCIECSEGAFANVSEGIVTCISCALGCQRCENQRSCLDCEEGLLWDNSTLTCVPPLSCPLSTYPDFQKGICDECFFMCDECNSASASNCSSCKASYKGDSIIKDDNRCIINTSGNPDNEGKQKITLIGIILGIIFALTLSGVAVFFLVSSRKKKAKMQHLPEGLSPFDFVMDRSLKEELDASFDSHNSSSSVLIKKKKRPNLVKLASKLSLPEASLRKNLSSSTMVNSQSYRYDGEEDIIGGTGIFNFKVKYQPHGFDSEGNVLASSSSFGTNASESYCSDSDFDTDLKKSLHSQPSFASMAKVDDCYSAVDSYISQRQNSLSACHINDIYAGIDGDKDVYTGLGDVNGIHTGLGDNDANVKPGSDSNAAIYADLMVSPSMEFQQNVNRKAINRPTEAIAFPNQSSPLKQGEYFVPEGDYEIPLLTSTEKIVETNSEYNLPPSANKDEDYDLPTSNNIPSGGKIVEPFASLSSTSIDPRANRSEYDVSSDNFSLPSPIITTPPIHRKVSEYDTPSSVLTKDSEYDLPGNSSRSSSIMKTPEVNRKVIKFDPSSVLTKDSECVLSSSPYVMGPGGNPSEYDVPSENSSRPSSFVVPSDEYDVPSENFSRHSSIITIPSVENDLPSSGLTKDSEYDLHSCTNFIDPKGNPSEYDVPSENQPTFIVLPNEYDVPSEKFSRPSSIITTPPGEYDTPSSVLTKDSEYDLPSSANSTGGNSSVYIVPSDDSSRSSLFITTISNGEYDAPLESFNDEYANQHEFDNV